jgi:hypothetical protein
MAKKQTVKSKPKRKPTRTRLARRDLRKLQDTGETHENVRLALTKMKGSPVLKGALALSRKSIVVAEKVFQWRLTVPKNEVYDQIGVARRQIERMVPPKRTRAPVKSGARSRP